MVRRQAWGSRVRLAAIFLAAAAASAQDAFLDRWKELAGRQPEGLKLRIAAPKAEFFLGEVIPLDLEFTSTRPRTFVSQGDCVPDSAAAGRGGDSRNEARERAEAIVGASGRKLVP